MTVTFFSKVKLYLGAYVTIFALAAFCLLCFHDRQADNPNLNDNSWKEGLHTNRTLMRDSDPLSLTYAGLRWTSNVFNCSVISEIENLELVGAGWTKAVYKGDWRGKTVAIKTVNLQGHDVIECSRRGLPVVSCYERAAVKILREIALLAELQHKNIIKVLGTCIPGWEGILMEGVSVVTEFGEPIDTIKLLQMSFAERLKLALDVAEILHHLAHSSLGSLAMLDFRKQQFVLVDRTLKLSDMDDISVRNCNYKPSIEAFGEETTLMASRSTLGRYNTHEYPAKQKNVFTMTKSDPNTTTSASELGELRACQKTQDEQHERHNILKAGNLFINNILIHNCPYSLRNQTEELVLAYTNPGSWNTSKILRFTQNLYQIYTTEEWVK